MTTTSFALEAAWEVVKMPRFPLKIRKRVSPCRGDCFNGRRIGGKSPTVSRACL